MSAYTKLLNNRACDLTGRQCGEVMVVHLVVIATHHRRSNLGAVLI